MYKMATVKLQHGFSFLVILVILQNIQGAEIVEDYELKAEFHQFLTNHTNPGKLQPNLNNHIGIADVDARCELCKYFIGALRNELTGTGVLGEIDSIFISECNKILPKSTHFMCNVTVYVVNKLFVELVTVELQPVKLCTNLGYCKASLPEGREFYKNPVIKAKFPVLCPICKDILQKVDAVIKRIMDPVNDRLKYFCHRLTPPTDQQCLKTVVKKYEDFENHVIKELLAPNNFCTKKIPVC